MAPPKVKNPRRSAAYYRKNADAREKKAEYDTKFNKKPAQLRKRRELAKWRRDEGIMGQGGPDGSHTRNGGIVRENASTNRARNRGKR